MPPEALMDPPPDLVRTAISAAAVGLTIVTYLGARRVQQVFAGACVLHPVLVSVGLGVGALALTGVSYDFYFANAYPLHFLLGPMTMLLAVPLIRQVGLIRRSFGPLCLALVLGSGAALTITAAVVSVSEGSEQLLATILPKSTTTAIAISLSDAMDGAPGLTAIVVILTGIFGAAFGAGLLRLARISDHRAIGLALGVSAHVIGSARAFQISETAGAFATIGTILNGLATAFLLSAIMLGAV